MRTDGPSPHQSSHPLLSGTDGLAASTRDALLLLARLLMGWIFVQSGFRKITDIPAFIATMSGRGLPDWLGYVAPPIELVGGLCLLLGLATRYTAVVMLLFLLIATFSTHAFWTYPAAQQANQASHFWKNITIMGGIVTLFVATGGRFSLDALLRRKS